MSTETLAMHGKSFYFAGRIMSKHQLTRAAKLYESCRRVDDIADETVDKKLARTELESIKVSIQNQQSLSHNVAVSVRETLGPSGQKAFLDLMDGVISDTGVVNIQTEQELIDYCYSVAGSVGIMMCDVLDVTDKKAYDFAVSLGVAMQLTNIARDVLEDAKMQRLYLPAEWLGDISANDIVEATDDTCTSVKHATEKCLSLAEDYYTFASLGLSYLPYRSRLAITVAAKVYREIGVLLKNKRNFDVWAGRVVVSLPRKIWVSMISVFTHSLNPSFYRKNSSASMPTGLASIRYRWTG